MKEYKYKINGIKFNVEVGDVEDNHVEVVVNGTHYTVELEKETKAPVKINATKAAAAPKTPTGEKVISKPAAASGAAGAVKAPLPGTIMSFTVKEGDTVNPGDTVCVLEAMKMENDVKSTVGGTVKKIMVAVGDSVLEGNDIMIIG
ncbi:MAG: acetyl-CoA carboxylase biotin carboxyl carrier protein subunit [Muribaculaceae bacterium]|nr:acetyl-CoA carboxylase biotin carboxyl carrier protein subunit [Muribaculaceae bacterium]